VGLAAATFLAVTTAAVASAAALAQSSPVPFVSIATGMSAAYRNPTHVVVRDAGGWQSLWTRAHGPRAAAAPAVDFTREMVVAMFAGTASGARTLTISRVAHDADAVVVSYVLHLAPSPDGESTPAAAPYHIIRTARSTLPVRFARIKSAPVIPHP
jgi:hypothetical protein